MVSGPQPIAQAKEQETLWRLYQGVSDLNHAEGEIDVGCAAQKAPAPEKNAAACTGAGCNKICDAGTQGAAPSRYALFGFNTYQNENIARATNSARSASTVELT